jgi:hypothetical protein
LPIPRLLPNFQEEHELPLHFSYTGQDNDFDTALEFLKSPEAVIEHFAENNGLFDGGFTDLFSDHLKVLPTGKPSMSAHFLLTDAFGPSSMPATRLRHPRSMLPP